MGVSVMRRRAAAIAAAACAVLTVAVVPAAATASPSVHAAPAPAQSASQSASRSTQPPACTDAQYCYTYDNIIEFYKQVVPIIEEFWHFEYQNSKPLPAGWEYVPTRTTESSACGDADLASYFYCPADQKVYIGQDRLWAFYILQGDGGALAGIAHEIGHHAQALAGVPLGVANPAWSVAIEDQADCFAGSFAKWALGNDKINSTDDVDDAYRVLSEVGSSEATPYRDHGTMVERQESFNTGLKNGLKACNSFMPDHPLI